MMNVARPGRSHLAMTAMASSLLATPLPGVDCRRGLGWSAARTRRHRAHSVTTDRGCVTPAEWRELFRLLLDYDYALHSLPGAQQGRPIKQKPEDIAPAAGFQRQGSDDDDTATLVRGSSSQCHEKSGRSLIVQGRLRSRLFQAVPPRLGPRSYSAPKSRRRLIWQLRPRRHDAVGREVQR